MLVSWYLLLNSNFRCSYTTCSDQVLGGLNDLLGVHLSTVIEEDQETKCWIEETQLSAFHTQFFTSSVNPVCILGRMLQTGCEKFC